MTIVFVRVPFVTDLEVKLENSSSRTFCVDNLDRMSVIACIRNGSLPYLVVGVQTVCQFTFANREEDSYLGSKSVHRLRRADGQLRGVPAAVLVDQALRTQRCEGHPARVCVEYERSQTVGNHRLC